MLQFEKLKNLSFGQLFAFSDHCGVDRKNVFFENENDTGLKSCVYALASLKQGCQTRGPRVGFNGPAASNKIQCKLRGKLH